jgi:protein SCO1/2
VLALLVAMAAAVAADAAVTLHRAGSGAARADGGAGRPLATGIALDKALPRLALVDEHGRTVSLDALRGRYVVLAPTLTLCHEVCPLTTAALEGVATAVRARGLQRRVTVAEVSVDPWRDSPARLRAFKRRTGTRLALFTGARAQLRRFWRAFGVRFERTRSDAGARDWWTGRRLGFDVSHTDGVFILDPRGRLRVFVGGMPGVGRLPARLGRLLNAEGRRNLRRPESPWNVSDVLDDLWSVMGLPNSGPPSPTAGSAAVARDAHGPIEPRHRVADAPPALAALRADGGRLLVGGPVARSHPQRDPARWHPGVQDRAQQRSHPRRVLHELAVHRGRAAPQH